MELPKKQRHSLLRKTCPSATNHPKSDDRAPVNRFSEYGGDVAWEAGFRIVVARRDGLDKNAALLASHAKENPAAGEGFDAMLEASAHRDNLGRVLAYQHK